MRKLPRVGDFHLRNFGDILPTDASRQRLRPQPRSLAHFARSMAPPAAEKYPQVHLVLPLFQPGKESLQPAKPTRWHAIDDELPLRIAKLCEGDIDR